MTAKDPHADCPWCNPKKAPAPPSEAKPGPKVILKADLARRGFGRRKS